MQPKFLYDVFVKELFEILLVGLLSKGVFKLLQLN